MQCTTKLRWTCWMVMCCSSERNNISIAIEPLTASEDIPSGWKQLSLMRQICEGDTLHVESAPWQCKVDVPKMETLLAGQHLTMKRIWALEVVQQGVEINQGHSHLQKKETKNG